MGNRSHVSEARDEPVDNACSCKVRYKLHEANINHPMLLALINNNSVIPEEEILREASFSILPGLDGTPQRKQWTQPFDTNPLSAIRLHQQVTQSVPRSHPERQ